MFFRSGEGVGVMPVVFFEGNNVSEPIEMFRVRHSYRFKFERVVVDRESDSCVWIKGSRTAKHSADTRYFHQFDAAKAYALSYQQNVARVAADKLREAEESVTSIVSMTAETIPTSIDRW